MWIPRVTLILMLWCMIACIGCCTMPPRHVPEATPPAPPCDGADDWPAPAEPRVVLQPGDIVKFQFLNQPELADEQMIRPDGKVSLQLVGEVEASGKTPRELHERLMSLYGPRVKNPEINVVVKGLDSRRAYVGGEVKAPGFIPLTSPKTVLQAIIESGGFIKESAQLRNVIIIRQRDGRQYARSLDLRKAIYDCRSTAFYLEPNDVVYVPRTIIDRVDQWVEQYINEIIPRNVHYTFTDSNYETDNRSETFQFVLP